MEERTLKFRAEDAGVTGLLRKYNKEQVDGARQAIDFAQKHAKTMSEFNKILEQQIKLYAERNKQARIEEMTRHKQEAVVSADYTWDRRAIEKQYKADVAGAKGQASVEAMMLKEIVAIFKSTGIKVDERQQDQQIRKHSRRASVTDTVGGRKAGFMMSTLFGTDEAAEQRLEQQYVKKFGGPRGKWTAEQEAEYRKAAGEKQDTRAQNVFAATLAANLVAQGLTKAGNAIGQVGGARDSDRGVAAVVSWIPFIGNSLAQLQTRHLDERDALQNAQKAFIATVNATSGSLSGGTAYGYKSADYYQIGTRVARSRMTSAGTAGATLDAVALTRAFGLDEGQVLGVNRGATLGGKGSMSVVSTLVQILGGLKSDMTKLPILLQAWTELQNKQISTIGRVDDAQNKMMLSAAMQIGGRFGIEPGAMGGISDAIAAPSTDYQKTRAFSVLSRMNPRQSTWQLLKSMEGGLSTPGYMTGVMQDVERSFGTGEGGEMALYGMLQSKGFSKKDTERIWGAYKKNRGMWAAGVGGTDLTGKIRALGKERTPPIDIEQAIASDQFASSAYEGTSSQLERTLEKLSGLLDKLVTTLAPISKAEAQAMNAFGANAGSMFDNTQMLPGSSASMADFFGKGNIQQFFAGWMYLMTKIMDNPLYSRLLSGLAGNGSRK